MNERLLKIMEHFNYSPSIFADEIGVIRSSISHIISGRNNPGLELLQKVLIRFPQISSDWLLLGRGEMLLSEDVYEAKKLTNVNYPKKIGQLNLDDLASVQPAKKIESPTIVNPTPASVTQNSSESIKPEPAQMQEKPVQIEAKPSQITQSIKSNASIKRLTIYFDDHSFKDFIEEKA